jgi:hypothetical protein
VTVDIEVHGATASMEARDGGYLIATVYTKLSERRALARARQAMNAYQFRVEVCTGVCTVRSRLCALIA